MGVAAPERVSSLTERLRAAQQVLATAEAAAGLRAVLPEAGRVGGPTTAPARAPGEAASVPAAMRERFLPVPDALVPIVPFGGVRRGSAVRVEGSASLLLGLAAAACREGAWCAVVGMPDLGLAAAVELGLPLDRVALVPKPGADVPAVLAAAVDGFDVIVLGEVPHLVERDRRQIASRLRHREAVLLTAGPWPGAEVVLSVTESRWVGVGQGHGSLRGRELVVRVGGRGAGGLGVQSRLRSPDGVRLLPAFGATGDGAREPRTGAGSVTADHQRRAG